jgi:hypothetical protein
MNDSRDALVRIIASVGIATLITVGWFHKDADAHPGSSRHGTIVIFLIHVEEAAS